MTPADRSDPVPPPRPGAETGPPPQTSPGADETQVEEIAFIVDPGSSQIPATAQPKLLHLAQDLRNTPLARVEIRAYSPVKGPSESDPRRLSLARWLAVRDYLVQNGVSDDRIDGRALGSTPTEPNADRIELYLER
jgi:outer membrane protein OmpA-like peptidoglycan-associated protein